MSMVCSKLVYSIKDLWRYCIQSLAWVLRCQLYKAAMKRSRVGDWGTKQSGCYLSSCNRQHTSQYMPLMKPTALPNSSALLVIGNGQTQCRFRRKQTLFDCMHQFFDLFVTLLLLLPLHPHCPVCGSSYLDQHYPFEPDPMQEGEANTLPVWNVVK